MVVLGSRHIQHRGLLGHGSGVSPGPRGQDPSEGSGLGRHAGPAEEWNRPFTARGKEARGPGGEGGQGAAGAGGSTRLRGR